MNERAEALLGHPARRRIVRWLHRDFEPHTVAEIRDALSLERNQVQYHGLVLAEQNIVKRFEGPHGRLLKSLVGDDPEVIAVLLSTQVQDSMEGNRPDVR